MQSQLWASLKILASDNLTFLHCNRIGKCPLQNYMFLLTFSQFNRYNFQLFADYLQSTVYCLLFTVYNPPFIVYYLQFTIHRLLFTVYNPPFTVYYLLFTVCYPPFTVYYLQFAIYRLLFTIYFPTSVSFSEPHLPAVSNYKQLADPL